jgi:nucleoside-diphosphate-sugar epimerase
MALYLVTGGAGFIGSNIVRHLLGLGEKVRVIDNFSTGRSQNLIDLNTHANLEVVVGDIRHFDLLRELSDGCDFVLHQAALPSVPRSIRDPLGSNAVNVEGTLNVLLAARDAGVRRVVFASSSSIYGNNPELPKHEEMSPAPLSPYAVGKYAAERYCRVFYELYGLETVALRYFNVFGPNQDPDSEYSAVIPKFIKAIHEGRQPVIYGDGLQSRDFTYVANNVEANLLACSRDGIAGQAFNIACGERYTLNELVDTIASAMGKECLPIYQAPRPGDVLHSMASIKKAKESMGYEVETGFRDGMGILVKHYLDGLKQGN